MSKCHFGDENESGWASTDRDRFVDVKALLETPCTSLRRVLREVLPCATDDSSRCALPQPLRSTQAAWTAVVYEVASSDIAAASRKK